jgi:hypothetical protein
VSGPAPSGLGGGLDFPRVDTPASHSRNPDGEELVEGPGDGVEVLPALADDDAPRRSVAAARVHRLARGRTSGLRPPRAVMPTVQAAAVAAGSFVAGAAVAGLVHRRQRRSAAIAGGRGAARALRTSPLPGRPPDALQIVGSRTLLVDVHVLGRPDPNR